MQLSNSEARKLVLHSQGIFSGNAGAQNLNNTLNHIEHLGYVQIDTISVVQRAHYHTLWSRNLYFQASDLDELLDKKQVFEYWSHAAAYLPMCDFRYTLPRKKQIAQRKEKHWYEPDEDIIKSVLKRVRDEGPLMAKDFKDAPVKYKGWGYKPSKQALEYLFMQGELMIPRRKNFHKVYDLTERVLPKNIDTSLPDANEYARFLILRYLRANGIGQAVEITYLLKHVKMVVSDVLKSMCSDRELIQVRINGVLFYTIPSELELLNKPLVKNKVKILSPFDNLLIQRKRIKMLFDFDYQLECYLPEKKRKFGFFSLPILWNDQFFARMDCKADRKTGVMYIKHLAFEKKDELLPVFLDAFQEALNEFMAFNDCNSMTLHKVSPLSYKPIVDRVIINKE